MYMINYFLPEYGLHSLENPYAVYEKKTNAYEIWKSLLYKVGKSIALNCPYANKSLNPAKEYFSDNCRHFMRHCQALMVDRENRPEISIPLNDGLLHNTVPGFIRQGIRYGYMNGTRPL